MERQGSELNGGIVLREFVTLEQLGKHPVSGMPLANEYRLFFLHRQLIQCMQYWEDADYRQVAPRLDAFIEIAQSMDSRFFKMDIAKTEAGDWIIIEVGDGQVSTLPGGADPERFYQSIMEIGEN
ncbi:ATP-grasp domain-containing protein [Paenibacillus sp. MWE-103]|uniref:ATP-grasp domain-containing protein n=1 Tax=Paenibacillus artemisiicola TaxID=1172618 RepID=A0ABS3WA07_9BACL|nr:ATP-grasp domain-containing protein [Paenibacillus artemisiicola]